MGRLSKEAVREWFFPLSPRKNGYRKDGYIVDCPDLIEPLFPHSPFSPTGKLAISEFGMAIGILRNGTKRNGMEQRHFTELIA